MVILQVDFVVEALKVHAFKEMYATVYRPALERQDGYRWSVLSESFSKGASDAIEATPRTGNVQLQLCFDSEVQRAAWADSADHVKPWQEASELSLERSWTAYDVLA